MQALGNLCFHFYHNSINANIRSMCSLNMNTTDLLLLRLLKKEKKIMQWNFVTRSQNKLVLFFGKVHKFSHKTADEKITTNEKASKCLLHFPSSYNRMLIKTVVSRKSANIYLTLFFKKSSIFKRNEKHSSIFYFLNKTKNFVC